jgi:hypothetical protein
MKIMNTIHKPTLVSILNIKRMVIFWTNSEDELVVRARPDCGGIWSPNHFVPLVSPNRLNKVNTISEVVLSPEV